MYIGTRRGNSMRNGGISSVSKGISLVRIFTYAEVNLNLMISLYHATRLSGKEGKRFLGKLVPRRVFVESFGKLDCSNKLLFFI